MSGINIQGLKGLTANDRKQWEQNNLSLINKYGIKTEEDLDRLYRDLEFIKLFKPEYNNTGLLGEALDNYNKEYESRVNNYNKLISLNSQDRDRLFANKAFEITFQGDSRYQLLAKLHPKERDALLLNEDFATDANVFLDNNKGKSWMQKAAESTSRWLDGVARKLGFNHNPLTAVFKGGPEGALMGGVAGSFTPFGLMGIVIGANIGGEGLNNIGAAKTKNDLALIIDKAVSNSAKLYTEDAANIKRQYEMLDYNNRNINPEYNDAWKSAWDDLVKYNPVWETFKYKKESLSITDADKRDLVFNALAVSNISDAETAKQVFDTLLNDLVSDKLDKNFFNRHVVRGAGTKFTAGFGEILSTLYALGYGGDNALKGLDKDGNPLPFLLNLEYWDGVDKYGTWDPNDIDDIKYDIHSDEYKEFISNGGTREQWIAQLYLPGERLKGTGISQYKVLRKVGDLHDWLSADGMGDAFEMSGYMALQATGMGLLSKLSKVKKLQSLGNGTRRMLNKAVKYAGAGPKWRNTWNATFTNFGNKLLGLTMMGITNIPISVGYAMTTYEDTLNKAYDDVYKRIDNEIASSPEYKAESLDIIDTVNYGLENKMITQQQADAIIKELSEKLYKKYLEQKKIEKLDEFKKAQESAMTAYKTDFAIESVRNIGIDMAFKDYIYRDATKMVKGVKSQKVPYSFGYKLSKANKPVAEATRSTKNATNKFTNKFTKFIENEDGTITRGKLRSGLDYLYYPAKNIWGGFYSNYMDDVTVGFSLAAGLNSYNNYIAAKYDLDTYTSFSNNILGAYFAGLQGGTEAAFNLQSFTDGFIGALGSVVSLPFIKAPLLLSRNYRRGKSGLLIAADLTGNPILGLMAVAQQEHKEMDSRLNEVNNAIKQNGSKLTDVNALLHWIAARTEADDWGDVIDIKDANGGLGFSIIKTLDDVHNISEGHSSLYKAYINKLMALAEGRIELADIDAFINNPDNAYLKEGLSIVENGEKIVLDKENLPKYAADRIKRNAEQLFDLYKEYNKNRGLVEASYGKYNIGDNIATLLSYMMTMETMWNNRLKDMEKELRGTPYFEKESAPWVEYTNAKVNNAIITDTKKLIDDIKSNINKIKSLLTIKLDFEAYVNQLKGFLKSAKLTVKDSLLREQLKEQLKQLLKIEKMLLKLALEKLKWLEYLKDRFKSEESTSTKTQTKANLKSDNETAALEEAERGVGLLYLTSPVSPEVIMALNPEQRYLILTHPEQFAEGLKEVVDNFIKEKETTDPTFMLKIKDSATLFKRAQDNRNGIEVINNNKESFLYYTDRIAYQALMLANYNYAISEEGQKAYKELKERQALTLVVATKNPDNTITISHDKNVKNIVNRVIAYILAKQPNVDISDISQVLGIFDLDREEIFNILMHSDDVELNQTGKEPITIDTVRDIIENTVNLYNLSAVEEASRQLDKNPEPLHDEKEDTVLKPKKEEAFEVSRSFNTNTVDNDVVDITTSIETTDIWETSDGKERDTITVSLKNDTDFGSIKVSKSPDSVYIVSFDIKKNDSKKFNQLIELVKKLIPNDRFIEINDKYDLSQRIAFVRGYNHISSASIEGIGKSHTYVSEPAKYSYPNENSIDKATVLRVFPNKYKESDITIDILREVHRNIVNAIDYRNDYLSAREYLSLLGMSELELQNMDDTLALIKADEMVYEYIDFMNTTTPEMSAELKVNQVTANSVVQNETKLEDDLTLKQELELNVFDKDLRKRNVSVMEFLNPLLWISKSPNSLEIKRFFSLLLGEKNSRNDELLAQYLKADNRPTVYYYVPDAWAKALLEKANYKLETMVPIVAIVEDSEGNITFEGDTKHYTPIGVAPVDSNAFDKVTLGLAHVQTLRDAALQNGLLVTDRILTIDGSPITSNIIRIVGKHPASMEKDEYKSVKDIAIDRLGYIPFELDNIFSGEQSMTSTNLYEDFRKEFLSNLVKEDNKWYYKYIYNGEEHKLELFFKSIQSSYVTVIEGGKLVKKPLLEVLNGPINSSIIRKVSLFSSLRDSLNVIFKSENYTESPAIKNDTVIGVEKLEAALTKAFGRVFSNWSEGLSVWSIKIDPTPFYSNGEPHMWVCLADTFGNLYNLYTIPFHESSTTYSLSDEAVTEILRNFLIDENGVFRGDENSTLHIPHLYWLVNYNDLASYAQAKEELDSNVEERKANNIFIVENTENLYDAGILSLSLDKLPGFEPWLTVPKVNKNAGGIAPVAPSDNIHNPDNAGSLESSPSPTTLVAQSESGSVALDIDSLKQESEDLMINLIKNSEQQVAQQDAAREARLKRAEETGEKVDDRGYASATDIASFMSDYYGEYANTAPTTIGKDADKLVRDFFLTELKESVDEATGAVKREWIRAFKKDNIDYSKYPTLSKEAVDELIVGMQHFENGLKLRDETIFTLEIVVNGTIKTMLKDGTVIDLPTTGRLDMVTVDKNGDFRIYDMKTFSDATNFLYTATTKYTTQLNIYKNSFEAMTGKKVIGTYLIPIKVNYPSETETDKYSINTNGQLLLGNRRVTLGINNILFGYKFNIHSLIDVYRNDTDEGGQQAEKVLKLLGFNLSELEAIKLNNFNTIIGNKINNGFRFTIDLSGEMRTNLTLDINTLDDNQKELLLTRVNNYLAQLGRQEADVSTMRSESSLTTKSENVNINTEDTANKAEVVGKEVIPSKDLATVDKDNTDIANLCAGLKLF